MQRRQEPRGIVAHDVLPPGRARLRIVDGVVTDEILVAVRDLEKDVAKLMLGIRLDAHHFRTPLTVGDSVDVLVALTGRWRSERTEHAIIGAVLEHEKDDVPDRIGGIEGFGAAGFGHPRLLSERRLEIEKNLAEV